MSVFTMILNYNRKHTEVLLERLVESQPTHPSAPLQRKLPCQTQIILSRTELPIVNDGVRGSSRLTDNRDATVMHGNQCARSQNVLWGMGVGGSGSNYL